MKNRQEIGVAVTAKYFCLVSCTCIKGYRRTNQLQLIHLLPIMTEREPEIASLAVWTGLTGSHKIIIKSETTHWRHKRTRLKLSPGHA